MPSGHLDKLALRCRAATMKVCNFEFGAESIISALLYKFDAPPAMISHAYQVSLNCFWSFLG